MRILFVALVMAASVHSAFADTIVIDGGSFVFSGPDANFFFPAAGHLSGAGFDLEIGVRNSVPTCGFGCAAGSDIDVEAFLINELARGNVIIGAGPPDVFASFSLVRSFHFTGGRITLPETLDENVELTGAFTFIGTMPIFVFGSGSPGDVDFDLLGSGTFTLALHQSTPGVFQLVSERFDFAPAPVPEPSLLLLLGGALTLMGGRRLARRPR
jgi:hypothetical protein